MNQQTGIVAWRRVEIGEHCHISRNVIIMDNDMHKHATGTDKPVKICKEVIIKDHVWIGINATILKGVTVGEGAIVAAGSMVTVDVEQRTLVAGVPARVIQENVVWEA
jgi:acetyltransferase-like isoleucine patch superfamily enzyme